jgi:putative NADPH-quinone reductase
MRALVVYCHPREGSFCSALRDAAVAGLHDAGHDTDVIDLAAEEFDPVMSEHEWREYRDMTGAIPESLRRHVELVRAAEILVFVYPTWWSGLPAQLKGWLERVLVPGVGFVLDDRGRVRPGLGRVRAIRTVSTTGSPRLYVALVNDNGRRILTRALRLSAPRRTRVRSHVLHSMDTTTPERRARFLAEVRRSMAAT